MTRALRRHGCLLGYRCILRCSSQGRRMKRGERLCPAAPDYQVPAGRPLTPLLTFLGPSEGTAAFQGAAALCIEGVGAAAGGEERGSAMPHLPYSILQSCPVDPHQLFLGPSGPTAASWGAAAPRAEAVGAAAGGEGNALPRAILGRPAPHVAQGPELAPRVQLLKAPHHMVSAK